MLVFTSCINNYIPKARVLAHSLKKFHPEWEFCLLLGETPPKDFNITKEPFDRILFFSDLGIPAYQSWLFRHRVVEVCTAAKGPALNYFINVEKQDKVIYLDPDIMVFNSLYELDNLLNEYDILLTPHQLSPQKAYQTIIDNEICSLKHGIFNLGFIAVAGRDQGYEFSHWWSDRLYSFCYDDIPNGLFTDQRWCDMVPAFFSKFYIIRDPGYNAATWNLTDRCISKSCNGEFLANDNLLRFYHFTGYDSGAGETMAKIYGSNMPELKKIWDIYAEQLKKFEHTSLKNLKWKGQFFDDGTLITDDMRIFYRKNLNIQKMFPYPFQKTKRGYDFYKFYQNNKSKQKAIFKFFKFLKFFIFYISHNGGIVSGLKKILKKISYIYKRQGFYGILKKINDQTNNMIINENIPRIDLNQIDTKDEFINLKNNLKEQFSHKARAICIVDHKYGGGAGAYSQQKIKEFLKEGNNIFYITWDMYEKNCDITIYSQEDSTQITCSNFHDICKIDWLFFSKIIVNELVTWNVKNKFGKIKNKFDGILDILQEIKFLIKKNNASLVILMHDYFSVCPSYTLLNYRDIFCDLPRDKKICKQCLLKKNIGISFSFDIEVWRKNWQELFDLANYIIFFSNSSFKIVKKIFYFNKDNILILPHKPLDRWDEFKYNPPINTPMIIGVIGNIQKHKGAQIITDMLPLLAKGERIVVIGELEGAHFTSQKLIVHGHYQHKDLPNLIKNYHITIAFIPSIWPETFSYTTQECELLNLPTVAFNLGAQGERIGKWKNGRLAYNITANDAYNALRSLYQEQKQKLTNA